MNKVARSLAVYILPSVLIMYLDEGDMMGKFGRNRFTSATLSAARNSSFTPVPLPPANHPLCRRRLANRRGPHHRLCGIGNQCLINTCVAP